MQTLISNFSSVTEITNETAHLLYVALVTENRRVIARYSLHDLHVNPSS